MKTRGDVGVDGFLLGRSEDNQDHPSDCPGPEPSGIQPILSERMKAHRNPYFFCWMNPGTG